MRVICAGATFIKRTYSARESLDQSVMAQAQIHNFQERLRKTLVKCSAVCLAFYIEILDLEKPIISLIERKTFLNFVCWYISKRVFKDCLLYTSPSPRDRQKSRMPSSA